MDRTLYYVVMKDSEGMFSNGAMGFYIDNPAEAFMHAGRIGGAVITVSGREMSAAEVQSNKS